ncbi:hypothetical protein AGMMS50293_14850 [Spirochaetia bacterium]|nr:hypothetical protein AGMMS50293_14850 [Spirochaetia bacterium]
MAQEMVIPVSLLIPETMTFTPRHFPALCAAVLCCAVLLSCAGFSAPKAQETQTQEIAFIREFSAGAFPANAGFVPAPLPDFRPAPGVGLVTRDEQDLGGSLGQHDRDHLSESFKSAYASYMLGDAGLAGVLGGDLVHGWPSAAPAVWVQNWRTGAGKLNSWGDSSLILAIQGLGQGRVFMVRGDILDAYGKSVGRGGANGAAGFGAPCGEEFLREGRIAQRFEFGLFTFGESGNLVFIPGDAPSAVTAVPATTGLFPSGDSDPLIMEAFQSAWRSGIDSGLTPMEPDTPVIRVEFTDPLWLLPVTVLTGPDREETMITLRNIYYQMFGNGAALFILADAAVEYSQGSIQLPFYARIVTTPFLEILLNAKKQQPPGAAINSPGAAINSLGAAINSPGAESPEPIPAAYSEKGGLTQLLLEGIALYGIPLSDSLLLNNGTAIQQAQRFSRGWLISR